MAMAIWWEGRPGRSLAVSKSYLMSSDGIKFHAKWHWVLSKVINMLAGVVINGIKCYQKSSNIIKCHQMLANVSKGLRSINKKFEESRQVSSNGIKCHQMSSSVIKCHQKSSIFIPKDVNNVIKCRQMSLSVTKCYQKFSKTNIQIHIISSAAISLAFESKISELEI